ncbi:S8 family peptidase [Streptomyces sp. NPDC007346]|uniref:S8 family peptidase n=1 Tax=Streptomyces sp. NPDC007346 TaxID=3154682 RepID=UPI0034552261
MKRSHLAAMLLALPAILAPAVGTAVAADHDSAPKLIAIEQAPDSKVITGNYIVTLKSGTTADGLVNRRGINTRHLYKNVFNGFSAKLSAQQLADLRRDPSVAAIEEDQKITASATQNNATWGLDRIDQRNRPLSGTYTYNRNGSGITAYIVDTGIDTNHADFGGRARNVYDAFGGNGRDCNGHGTHVAGTVGGTTYGVAKGVALRGVRVLDCNGSGSYSGIIAGFDWIRNNAVKPAVANASLGGGYSSAVNNAAAALNNSGVFLAVAAGNSNDDACNYSPATAPGVISVAASDSSDRRASFSNFGRCTDIFAPGVSVTSARLGGGTTQLSGTSMASPHVAGVAALYKANRGEASSSTINNWLINNATTNVISGANGSPNRLLFKADF